MSSATMDKTPKSVQFSENASFTHFNFVIFYHSNSFHFYVSKLNSFYYFIFNFLYFQISSSSVSYYTA